MEQVARECNERKYNEILSNSDTDGTYYQGFFDQVVFAIVGLVPLMIVFCQDDDKGSLSWNRLLSESNFCAYLDAFLWHVRELLYNDYARRGKPST